MPTCCAANEITVVVPPNAAAVVALSNVSAFIRPDADNCSMWLWLSTPPGSTSLPRASISRLPLSSPSAIAAMVVPRMPRSAFMASVAVATVPPRITRSKVCMISPRHSGARAPSPASPESIATSFSVLYGPATVETAVVMDSGLVSAGRPGMTSRECHACHARYFCPRRLHHRGDAVQRRRRGGHCKPRPADGLLHRLRHHRHHGARHHGRGAEADPRRIGGADAAGGAARQRLAGGGRRVGAGFRLDGGARQGRDGRDRK